MAISPEKFVLTRRAFLGVSAAGMAVALLPDVFAGVARRGEGNTRRLVIVDRRFGTGHDLERMADNAGMQVAAHNGDITQIWTQLLRPALDCGPMAVAGVSSASALFALEQLSDRHRMLVAHRADAKDGRVLRGLIDVLGQDIAMLPAHQPCLHSIRDDNVPLAWLMRPTTSARRHTDFLKIHLTGA